MTTIPDYSNVNVTSTGAAGGSNGARVGRDEWNQPWLIKHYPGPTGEDRMASELLANSIYRTLGAQTPHMGVRHDNGYMSITYPMVQGEPSYFSGDHGDMEKRRALGHHFATDALLGNWDFGGLDDDNVLWNGSEPTRIDHGSSFEYRAQGSPKEYGPNVDEMNNLLTIGQGKDKILTTEPELRQQAAHIGRTLTPDVVHQLVYSAPFADSEMQQRIHDNLNARVNWMRQFGDGQIPLSPEAQQTLQRHQALMNMPRVSATSDELHIYLDVNRYPSRHIFRWARDQQWPEGTELEDFNDYHITLLYSPEGYKAFHKAQWANPEINKTEVSVVSFENFGPDEDGQITYVLLIDGPEIKEIGEKIQNTAASMGVIDTHYGSYRPHITIGYGYEPIMWMEVPGIVMDVGPVKMSTPRVSEPTFTKPDNDMENIGNSLHQEFQNENTPEHMVRAARAMLRTAHYPLDDLSIQAALQAWQTMYPEDQVQWSKPRTIMSEWDSKNGWNTGSLTAARHCAANPVPGDEKFMNRAFYEFAPNPNAGVHASYIQKGDPPLYIKPEGEADFHSESPIKERGAFVLGNSMGYPIPHTVVRRATVPLQWSNGERQAYASVHEGIPNSRTLGAIISDAGMNARKVGASGYLQYLDQFENQRRRMMLLDQVLGNSDRHTENVLVNQDGEWIPIDHGGSFSRSRDILERGLNYQAFDGHPLTPIELEALNKAYATISHPDHRDLFNDPAINLDALRDRLNYMLTNKTFIPLRAY